MTIISYMFGPRHRGHAKTSVRNDQRTLGDSGPVRSRVVRLERLERLERFGVGRSGSGAKGATGRLIRNPRRPTGYVAGRE